MFGRKNDTARQELRDAKRDLNARFNNRDADPDSSEYLAANDRVVRAEKNARRR
jgi:hypothetical protein